MIGFIDIRNIVVKKSDEKGNMKDILKEVTLTIEKEDIFAILGPSGSGKSSLLRLLNRLEDAFSGEIYIEGKEIKEWDVKTLREKVGFVFQESALFEGTVMDNILYGLRLRNFPKLNEKEKAEEILHKVGLEIEFLERDISSLSGGQKQRVNIGRTLALEPDILLMDEPTSALDPLSTRTIEKLIQTLNKQYGKTIILVSHNLAQIKRIAKHGMLILDGKSYCQGLPDEVFACQSKEVNRFFEEVEKE